MSDLTALREKLARDIVEAVWAQAHASYLSVGHRRSKAADAVLALLPALASALPSAPPREPEPGELVRCCLHLLGDCELRPDGYHNSKRWHCRCCGISWHWTHAAPSSRVIPASLPPTPETPEEKP